MRPAGFPVEIDQPFERVGGFPEISPLYFAGMSKLALLSILMLCVPMMDSLANTLIKSWTTPCNTLTGVFTQTD